MLSGTPYGGALLSQPSDPLSIGFILLQPSFDTFSELGNSLLEN
jgi:hypothetical protein